MDVPDGVDAAAKTDAQKMRRETVDAFGAEFMAPSD
jgi:hypothetical protein